MRSLELMHFAQSENSNSPYCTSIISDFETIYSALVNKQNAKKEITK
jgi:hypothetical protein